MERMEIEEMSDHELLMELVAEKRRNDRIRLIRYGIDLLIMIFVCILAWIYIPKIVKIIDQFNDLMKNYGELVGKLNSTDLKINEFMEAFDSDFGNMKEFMEQFSALMGRFGF